MSTIPRAPSRPVWVPEPFLARTRTGFTWLAVSGVFGAIAIAGGLWVGENDTTVVVLALLGLIVLALTAVIVGLLLVAAGALRGPGDGMSAYGAGRRVEVTWAPHGRERGRIAVEDVGEGEVVAFDRDGHDQPPHVTLRLGAHDLLLQGGPSATAPTWYTLVDDGGMTVARAEAALRPGAASAPATADWTVWPAHGPALRLRHRPTHGVPARVTLLDELGTAWSVEDARRAWWLRDARRAELPDELDPASAVFTVMLVDMLRRSKLAGSKVNKY